MSETYAHFPKLQHLSKRQLSHTRKQRRWETHFFGSKPSARIATFSSLASIVPEPSVSKRSNASRISCFCSSVSSNCQRQKDS